MNSVTDPSLKLHPNRPDLIGEYKWGDSGQVILLLLFLVVWVLDSFVFRYSTFLADLVPGIVLLVVGTLVLIIAGYLARSGLKTVFGNQRPKPEVIRSGVFSVVRHPIYLGSILLYLGLIVYTLSLLALGMWMIIVVFYVFISHYEEKILTQYFGKEYRQYKKEVPMLFPRIKTRLYR